MHHTLNTYFPFRLSRYFSATLAHRHKISWSLLIFLTDGALAFVTGITLARLLGPTQIGAMAAVIAGLSLFTSFFEGGIGTYTTRAVAQDTASYRIFLSDAIGVRLIYSLPVLAVLTLSLYGMGALGDASGLLWSAGALYLVATNFYGTLFSVYAGRQAFSSWWAVAAPSRLLALVTSVAAAQLLGTITAAYLAGAATLILTMVGVYWLNGCRTITLNLRQVRLILAASLPFLLWNLTSGLTLRFDSFWLGVTRNAYETGLYTAAYQCFLYLGSSCVPLFTLAYPVLARRFIEDINKYKEAAWLSLLMVSIISGLAGAFLIFYAPGIIAALYGRAFLEAVPLASLLGYCLVPMCLNRILGIILITGKLEWFVASGSVVSCLANIGLNLWFIPIYGAIAAVYTTFIAETLCALIYGIVFFIRRFEATV